MNIFPRIFLSGTDKDKKTFSAAMEAILQVHNHRAIVVYS